jgi:hypothetical protein
MKRTMLSLAFAVCILALVPWTSLSAAPQPPLVVANHETKECGTIMGGDECMDCFPPEGWEILGYPAECPAGYTEVHDIPGTCKHFKTAFCCTQGHSGAAGDCKDLVRNRKSKQCAFVQDIAGCQLPAGWAAKPADQSLYDWLCPNHYEWVETLNCVTATSTAQTDTDKSETQPNGIPCLGVGFIGPVIILLWLVTETKR